MVRHFVLSLLSPSQTTYVFKLVSSMNFEFISCVCVKVCHLLHLPYIQRIDFRISVINGKTGQV